MKAHKLAELLRKGPDLPVVYDTRDSDMVEVVGVKVELTTFWGPEGRNDPRPRDHLGYPIPAECVYLDQPCL